MLSRLSSSPWMDDPTAVSGGGGVDDDPTSSSAIAAAWSSDPSPVSSSALAASSILDDAGWYAAAAAAADPTFSSIGMGGPHMLSNHHLLHSSSDPTFLLPPSVGPTSFSSLLASAPFDTSTSSFQPPPSGHVPSFSAFGPSSSDFSGFGSVPSAAFNPITFDTSSFDTRSKILRPLDLSSPMGAAPTLFQKRAARQNPAFFGRPDDKRLKGTDLDDSLNDDVGSFDGSGLNYDSDELSPDNTKGGDEEGNNASDGKVLGGGTGGENKGQKKGLPVKNLMVERRRRKKLNDRLYMLRPVVPKIGV